MAYTLSYMTSNHSELAAKYMPSLVEKIRTSDVPWDSAAVMLNVISFTFVFRDLLRSQRVF